MGGEGMGSERGAGGESVGVLLLALSLSLSLTLSSSQAGDKLPPPTSHTHMLLL